MFLKIEPPKDLSDGPGTKTQRIENGLISINLMWRIVACPFGAG